MTRYRLTLLTLALSAQCALSDAHAEVKGGLIRPYVRFQTGFQSGSLDDQTPFSYAWEVDLGFGLLSDYVALELNSGLSLSEQDYQRSKIIEVNSHRSFRLEGLLYYPFIGSTSLFVGVGVGRRTVDQTATYRYREGDIIQIRSNAQRELSEEATSLLVRVMLSLESRVTLSADYDQFSLIEGEPYIKTLGINIGYAY